MTRYGIVLSCICIFDLTYTAVGLAIGWFEGEINPILAWFLNRWGIIGLASAKMFFNAIAISALELVSGCI